MPTQNDPTILDRLPRLSDFLFTGPCQQRPGIRNVKTGKVMTTCPTCHGLMWAGECARDNLKGSAESHD